MLHRVVILTEEEIEEIVEMLPAKWKRTVRRKLLRKLVDVDPDIDGEGVVLPWKRFVKLRSLGKLEHDGETWKLRGRTVYIDWTTIDGYLKWCTSDEEDGPEGAA